LTFLYELTIWLIHSMPRDNAEMHELTTLGIDGAELFAM
jgi:hypothetical protein